MKTLRTPSAVQQGGIRSAIVPLYAAARRASVSSGLKGRSPHRSGATIPAVVPIPARGGEPRGCLARAAASRHRYLLYSVPVHMTSDAPSPGCLSFEPIEAVIGAILETGYDPAPAATREQAADRSPASVKLSGGEVGESTKGTVDFRDGKFEFTIAPGKSPRSAGMR